LGDYTIDCDGVEFNTRIDGFSYRENSLITSSYLGIFGLEGLSDAIVSSIANSEIVKIWIGQGEGKTFLFQGKVRLCVTKETKATKKTTVELENEQYSLAKTSYFEGEVNGDLYSQLLSFATSNGIVLQRNYSGSLAVKARVDGYFDDVLGYFISTLDGIGWNATSNEIKIGTSLGSKTHTIDKNRSYVTNFSFLSERGIRRKGVFAVVSFNPNVDVGDTVIVDNSTFTVGRLSHFYSDVRSRKSNDSTVLKMSVLYLFDSINTIKDYVNFVDERLSRRIENVETLRLPEIKYNIDAHQMVYFDYSRNAWLGDLEEAIFSGRALNAGIPGYRWWYYDYLLTSAVYGKYIRYDILIVGIGSTVDAFPTDPEKIIEIMADGEMITTKLMNGTLSSYNEVNVLYPGNTIMSVRSMGGGATAPTFGNVYIQYRRLYKDEN
jgi:hypothetical protein